MPGISKMKNLIIVTGGAGFVGSNLIKSLLKKTNSKIISIDNYSSGSIKNHIKNNRVKYINGDTANINKILDRLKSKIKVIFHFGEFSRIFQSFKRFDECYYSNSIGSKAVFKFCLDNKIKLIYSATSASLGKNGQDKNLSPYAFTKSKNIKNSSLFIGEPSSSQSSLKDIDNISILLPVKNRSSYFNPGVSECPECPKLNIGLSYTRIKDFGNDRYYRGYNDNNSIIDYFLYDAQAPLSVL